MIRDLNCFFLMSGVKRKRGIRNGKKKIAALEINQTTIDCFFGSKRKKRKSRAIINVDNEKEKTRRTEDVLIGNWILKKKKEAQNGERIKKRCCVLLEYISFELKNICGELNVLWKETTIEELCQETQRGQSKDDPIDLEEIQITVYEFDIETKQQLKMLTTQLKYLSQIFVIRMNELLITDMTLLISECELFIPMKDGIEYMMFKLNSSIKKDKINLNKPQIKKIFDIFSFIKEPIFYIIQCLYLIQNGLCQFCLDSDIIQPFQLIKRFYSKTANEQEMLIYSIGNDELKDLVYWYCLFNEPLDRLHYIYTNFCYSDIFDSIKPSYRTDLINELKAMHSIILPIYCSSNSVKKLHYISSKQSQFKMNIDIKEKINNILPSSSKTFVSRNQFIENVFPFILQILINCQINFSSKNDKFRFKQQFLDLKVDGKSWRLLIQNSPFQSVVNQLTETRKKFILSFFDY
ncbi:hypothetical protein ENU1_124670 [Entamoeba nuttalli P19]|uniref:Uncharacterized protein n=2 Tax=Entamoeba nuttalli TaxID=412467 RepID=K2GAJ6_ENTNP|nr:hypothetical protein ENU1_124670 [Entamoeba nuttalli P19]EKE39541.1 hypothetical protein ENU1_124670 [Entamoeba nuttalli P19]|eukprot:XP_008858128.1 hypothetical protein ENU1_124670 [Entamoeba nuttalli P19]